MVYQLPLLAGTPGLSHGFSTRKEGDQRSKGTQPKRELIRNQAAFLRQVCPKEAGYPLGVAVRMLPLQPGLEEEIVIVSSVDAGRGMAASEAVSCEAMVTDSPNVFPYIALADCVPVILFDPRRRVLALVHGGRGSTVRKLPEKTLAVMRKQFRTDPADVIVGMGPGFRSHWVEWWPAGISDPIWNAHIRPNGNRTLLMDLFGYNNDRLVASGVPKENIDECPHDTYKRPDLFFSHRLFSEIGGIDGRHACAVGMVE